MPATVPSQNTSAASNLSQPRKILALLALALGGFGIGLNEFSAMGLLSQFSRDLLPELYANAPELANAQSGWLITAYAAGVVIGAPTIGIFAAKYPRKGLLLILSASFVVTIFFTALASEFWLVFLGRFISGLPHGAYFGVAALVAVELMGEGKRAMGVAVVMAGLTVSNIVGVPTATWVGQTLDWRAATMLVVIVFALTFLAILLTIPKTPGDPSATPLNELKAFTLPQVWFALAMGAIGFGGFFAVLSYVDPLLTEVTGQPEWVIPLALVLVGIGMTIGNFFGGWFADRGIERTIIVSFILVIAVFAVMLLTAEHLIPVMVLLFMMGFGGSMLAPSIQVRLMDVAKDSKTVAATANHSSLNIGNALGAFLGSVVIAAGLGYSSPIFVGIVLSVLGLAIALIGFWLQKRSGQRDTAKG